MIFVDNGMTKISGDMLTVMAELTQLIEILYNDMKERFDDEFAREQIATAGRLAFMSDEELRNAAADLMKEV